MSKSGLVQKLAPMALAVSLASTANAGMVYLRTETDKSTYHPGDSGVMYVTADTRSITGETFDLARWEGIESPSIVTEGSALMPLKNTDYNIKGTNLRDFFNNSAFNSGDYVKWDAPSQRAPPLWDTTPSDGGYGILGIYNFTIPASGVQGGSYNFNILGDGDGWSPQLGSYHYGNDNLSVENIPFNVVVPEPTTLVPLALGAGAFLARRRRK